MRKPSSLIALLAALLLPAAASAEISATSMVLDAGAPERSRFGRLEWRGSLRLSGLGDFGGLSALLYEDGVLTAVSDKGNWYGLRPWFEGGRLAGVALVGAGKLAGPDGAPIDDKFGADAESLARLDGGILVAFERDHRLWRYDGLDALPAPVATPEQAKRLPSNGGLEAITELADGRLLLLSEEGGDARAVAGWIGRPGDWRPVAWRRTGEFKPTAAAVLPDGRVVVLERRFSILGGVGARLSVVDPAELVAGATLSGGELAQFGPPLAIDNFEGLAAATGTGGETLLYIVSDDNFSPLQSTQMHVFVLH